MSEPLPSQQRDRSPYRSDNPIIQAQNDAAWIAQREASRYWVTVAQAERLAALTGSGQES